MRLHDKNLRRLALRWQKSKRKMGFNDFELAALERFGVRAGLSEHDAWFAGELLRVRIGTRLARIEILGE